jgi:hypothetical protein
MVNGKYAHCVHEGLKPIGESLGIEIVPHEGKLFTSIMRDNFSNNCPNNKVWVEIDLYSTPGCYHGVGGEFVATRKRQTLLGYAEKPGQVPSAMGIHRHTVDEAFFLFGSNSADITFLGGEYEFYLGAGEDAEKYTFTKNTCVYVPAGVYHSPQGATRVDDPSSPIIEMALMLCMRSPKASSYKHVDPLSYCNMVLGNQVRPPHCCLLKKVRTLLEL